tara:strand:+ start:943 stop:3081 length:2139 start_codon:yes stop_codon:yes gene_type:complete
MAILKALPGSAKINGKPVKGKLIQIKKSVINIDKFLEKRKERSIKEIEKAQKQNQNFKRKKKEEKLEEPKKEWKKLVPKKIPGLSFLDSIKKFISGWIFGFIAIKLIPLLPSLIPVVINLGKMVNFIIDIGGKFLNGFISFVDFGVKASEATIGFIKNLGGEKFAENFEKFAKTFGFVIDSMLILGALMIKDALSGDSGFGVGDLLGKKGLGKFFGKKAVASGLTKTAASTTATAGGAAGGTASTAAGIGAGAAAGIVAGAGLLASGLGEGIFQMLREARKQEADSYKRFKDKGWWNPMKYFWGAAHLGQKFSNFQIQILGTILDIVGAPFRYIIELIRYPFLSKEDKKKQQENLAKFDARIRESFREIVNTLSLGMLAKEKGSFGSLFGKKGTDAMGYTKDGKSVTEKKDVTPAVAPTPKTTDGTFRSNVKDPVSDRIGGTFHKNKGAIIGGALGSALGPLGVVAGAAIGSSIQKRGIKGVIGGAADFVTGGMFDFDKKNPKGSPKGFGIKRVMGGVADWATMGLTDFDKRGAGILQFNPISGGKDKRWGKEYKIPQRILDHRDKVNKLRNMSQFATKDGRTISMVDMLTSGDRSQIEEALYMQRAKERDPSEGHSDWVGNPKYEAETLKYLKPPSTSESPLKMGTQEVKFDEELLGVSASYETNGGQKEYTIYAPTTQINMLPGNNSGQVVTSGATVSSGDDPYEILEKG